jgi:hypothetical protein
MDASNETRDTIKRFAQEGKVEFAGDVSNINLADPDFTVEKVELIGVHSDDNEIGFGLGWETVSAGFGTTEFYVKNGKLYCANECMGKKFLTSLMTKFVESCILEDEP